MTWYWHDTTSIILVDSLTKHNEELTILKSESTKTKGDISREISKYKFAVIINKDSTRGQRKFRSGREPHPSQQKFFEFLGTRNLCSLFHIFTHTPVGIPTVYVQLEFQLCPLLQSILRSLSPHPALWPRTIFCPQVPCWDPWQHCRHPQCVWN